MSRRRGSKQKITVQDRLSAWADEIRKQAGRLPPGPERDDMLKKASHADTASRLYRPEMRSQAGLRG
jgi:hypothetical protein